MPASRSPYPPDRDGPDGRDRPVIWTVSVTRLQRLFSDLTPEFDPRARIEPINHGFEDAVRHIRRRLQTEHCDALIAAGSNGAYLRHRIDKPVVLVRASGFDLMAALSQARRLSDRIGVVTHQAEPPEFTDFQRSFGLQIVQRSFVTAEDARNRVAELVAAGIKVLVGTGMVVDLAEQAGIAGILLYSAASIRLAFEDALEIAQHLRSADAARPALAAPRRRAGATSSKYELAHLLGDSAPMQQLRDRIAQYAAADATVLITGATGTGKELVAQALHAASPRRAAPFVAVNCGAIAESLLESELFGYEEGAFTGSRRGGRIGLIESARGGTLFLDEIGEMPLALQTRLLRVLEEREVVRVGASKPVPVDLRVIAASHCDLTAMVAQNRFRADLYYRLNVLRLHLPALREREADVAQLALAFLRAAGGHAEAGWKKDALLLLQAYTWPGNVRELRNVVERVAVAGGPGRRTVDAGLLLQCAPELAATPAAMPAPSTDWLQQIARGPTPEAVAQALAQAGGNRGRAAELLGISRATLWRKLRRDGAAESAPEDTGTGNGRA